MAPTATTPPSGTNDTSPDLLNDLNTRGYTILRSHISPPLVQKLLLSSRKLTRAARNGQWPHLRTCPKQFPPWPSKPGEEGIWGVQHLLHPGLYSRPRTEDTPIPEPPLTQDEAAPFAELYFSDLLTNPINEILSIPSSSDSTEDTRLTLELLNLLITPPRPFSLRWHRDAISSSLSPDEEAAALGLIHTSTSYPHSSGHNPFASTQDDWYVLHPAFRKHGHTQYNAPLLDDSSLHLVPGSHLRPRTERERKVLERDERSDELPGWVEVKLKVGDVVFYNSNLIHRGVYGGLEPDGHGGDEGGGRYTLHGSVSDAEGGADRARTVLQHGVGEWVSQCEFGDLLAEVPGGEGERLRSRAESMRQRLMELGGSVGGDAVGYNHDD